VGIYDEDGGGWVAKFEGANRGTVFGLTALGAGTHRYSFKAVSSGDIDEAHLIGLVIKR
jgi:hypothetical protein